MPVISNAQIFSSVWTRVTYDTVLLLAINFYRRG